MVTSKTLDLLSQPSASAERFRALPRTPGAESSRLVVIAHHRRWQPDLPEAQRGVALAAVAAACRGFRSGEALEAFAGRPGHGSK